MAHNTFTTKRIYIVGANSSAEFGIGHYDAIHQLTAWNPPNPTPDIQELHVGRSYFILTDNQQHPWCAGCNHFGQLGQGRTFPSAQFRQNRHLTRNTDSKLQHIFTSVSGDHTFWIRADGQVLANGNNQHNQLGLRSRNDSVREPVLIGSLSDTHIADIQSGLDHCIALGCDGKVFSTTFTGDGDYGQNGGRTASEAGFREIPFFRRLRRSIRRIATGARHSVFVDESNAVWSCGDNINGQCGLSERVQHTAYSSPQRVPPFVAETVGVVDVQCGYHHTLLLLDDGTVYVFGANGHGQCGVRGDGEDVFLPQRVDGLKGSYVTRIQCGYVHSYVCTRDGRHWFFGSNGCNECSLRQAKEDKICSPLCVNAAVSEMTSGGCVERVYLGVNSTWIIISRQLLVIGFLRLMAEEYGQRMAGDVMKLAFMFYE